MNFDKLMDIRSEITSYDGYFSELDYTEDLDTILSSYSPSDIVRMTCDGNANFYDDYFLVDDYENLKSCSEYELKEMYEDNERDILQYAIHYDIAKEEAIEYIMEEGFNYEEFGLEKDDVSEYLDDEDEYEDDEYEDDEYDD